MATPALINKSIQWRLKNKPQLDPTTWQTKVGSRHLVSGRNRLGGQTLRNDMASYDTAHVWVGIMCYVRDADGDNVGCLAHSFKYFGDTASNDPSDKKTLCMLGDIDPTGYARLTFLPSNAFEIVKRRVPLLDQVMNEFGKAPDAALLGPYSDGDGVSQVIEGRNFILIPLELAELLIGMEPKELTPRKVGIVLLKYLINSGSAADHEALVNSLLISVCEPEAGTPNEMILGDTDTYFPYPPETQLFHQFRHNFLRGLDLLDQPQSLASNADIVAELGRVNQGMQDRHEADKVAKATEKAKEKNKNISELDEYAAEYLVKMCHVNNETLLPPTLKKFWNAKDEDRKRLLQQACNKRAEAIHFTSPEITQDTVKTVDNCPFHVAYDAVDNFEEGLNLICHGCPHGSNQGLVLRGQSENQELVRSGGLQVSETVLCTVVNKKNLNFPATIREAFKMLEAFVVLLDVLFGVAHPLNAGIRMWLITSGKGIQDALDQTCRGEVEVADCANRVIYWLHQRVALALLHMATTGNVEPVNFQDLFLKLAGGRYERLATLPPKYLKKLPTQSWTSHIGR